MRLAHFIYKMSENVTKFNKWYYNNYQTRHDLFPLELDEGEWMEQFLSWIKNQEGV